MKLSSTMLWSVKPMYSQKQSWIDVWSRDLCVYVDIYAVSLEQKSIGSSSWSWLSYTRYHQSKSRLDRTQLKLIIIPTFWTAGRRKIDELQRILRIFLLFVWHQNLLCIKKICPPFVGLKIVNELIAICFYFRYMCMFISQDSLVRLWILLQCKL